MDLLSKKEKLTVSFALFLVAITIGAFITYTIFKETKTTTTSSKKQPKFKYSKKPIEAFKDDDFQNFFNTFYFSKIGTSKTPIGYHLIKTFTNENIAPEDINLYGDYIDASGNISISRFTSPGDGACFYHSLMHHVIAMFKANKNLEKRFFEYDLTDFFGKIIIDFWRNKAWDIYNAHDIYADFPYSDSKTFLFYFKLVFVVFSLRNYKHQFFTNFDTKNEELAEYFVDILELNRMVHGLIIAGISNFLARDILSVSDIKKINMKSNLLHNCNEKTNHQAFPIFVYYTGGHYDAMLKTEKPYL